MPSNTADINGHEVSQPNGLTPAHPAFDSIPDVLKAFGTSHPFPFLPFRSSLPLSPSILSNISSPSYPSPQPSPSSLSPNSTLEL